MCHLNTIKRLLGLPPVEDTSEILSRISRPNDEAQERALGALDHAEAAQDQTKAESVELSAAARNIRHVSAATIMRMRHLNKATQL